MLIPVPFRHIKTSPWAAPPRLRSNRNVAHSSNDPDLFGMPPVSAGLSHQISGMAYLKRPPMVPIS